jgi:mono/diheme cytochrome c family protein
MKRVLVVAALLVTAYGIRVQMRAPAPQVVRVNAAAQADTVIARGHAVYDRYGCSMCHGPDGKGGFANPNAETEGKVPGVTFVAEGFTRRELRQKILDGFAAVGRKDANGPRPPYRMPGWAGQMTDPEVADLVEYLWSLYPKSETEKWR